MTICHLIDNFPCCCFWNEINSKLINYSHIEKLLELIFHLITKIWNWHQTPTILALEMNKLLLYKTAPEYYQNPTNSTEESFPSGERRGTQWAEHPAGEDYPKLRVQGTISEPLLPLRMRLGQTPFSTVALVKFLHWGSTLTKAIWRRKGFIWLTHFSPSLGTSLPWEESQGIKSGREQTLGAWIKSHGGLLLIMACSVCNLIQPRTMNLLKGSTTYHGQGPLTLINNQENAPQICLQKMWYRQFFIWGSFKMIKTNNKPSILFHPVGMKMTILCFVFYHYILDAENSLSGITSLLLENSLVPCWTLIDLNAFWVVCCTWN